MGLATLHTDRHRPSAIIAILILDLRKKNYVKSEESCRKLQLQRIW